PSCRMRSTRSSRICRVRFSSSTTTSTMRRTSRARTTRSRSSSKRGASRASTISGSPRRTSRFIFPAMCCIRCSGEMFTQSAAGALEPHLSSEILDLHYHKHHPAYVKGANDTLEKLEQARSEQSFAHIGQLEKNLAFHLSGHVLHSLLWKNVSSNGGGRPTGTLAAGLDEHFGSFDAFRAQLDAAASSVQGSGWGALS